jgi:hypothetical protein
MSLKDTYSCAWEVLSASISSGSSLTGALNLGGLRLFAIVIPSAWTSANLTFQMSPDAGTTWVNIYDINGNELTAVAAASECIVLTPVSFSSFQYLRIRSGTSSSAVSQAADRSLQLLLRAV